MSPRTPEASLPIRFDTPSFRSLALPVALPLGRVACALDAAPDDVTAGSAISAASGPDRALEDDLRGGRGVVEFLTSALGTSKRTGPPPALAYAATGTRLLPDEAALPGSAPLVA